MNDIFMHNMQVVMNKPKENEDNFNIDDARFGLKKGTVSYDVIKHLFEHGETTGSKLIKIYNLPRSPMSYIRKHINSGMIIPSKVTKKLSKYKVRDGVTKEHFGMFD